MKKSELATVIREEFLALLKEEGTVTTDDSAEAEKLAKKGVDVNLTKEEMTDKEREDKLQQAKRGGGKEEPLRKLAKIGKDKVKEEMDDDEMDKAASKGVKGKDAKGVAAQATAALKAQGKKKALSAFMDKMKAAGVVSDSNKVLDAGKYKDEFAKFKASL